MIATGQRHCLHDTRRGVFTDVFQPPGVNVLKFRVGRTIGDDGVRLTVKANHDTVQCNLSGDLCTQQLLEVFWLLHASICA